MAGKQRVGSLEIHQDVAFQEKMWRVQRVGWVIAVLLLLAILIGLMGGAGPISRGTAGDSADPFWFEYERFTRRQAPAELLFHFGSETTSGEELRLLVDRSYLQSVQIQAITPEPDSVSVMGDQLAYVFTIAELGQPLDILFQYKPSKFGSLEGSAGLPDGTSHDFSQFVYP